METKQAYVTDYTEIEEIITGIYDLSPDWRMEVDSNDIAYAVTLTGNTYEWENESISNELEEKKEYDVSSNWRAYLEELVYFGILPAGYYVIEVSW